MAVSGADWRKSTDEPRTETPRSVFPVRSSGRVPAAFAPPFSEDYDGVARTLADNTDNSGIATVLNPVETNGGTVPDPLAIEDATGAAVVAACSDDERTVCVDDGARARGHPHPAGDALGGNEIYLGCFTLDSSTRRRAVIVE